MRAETPPESLMESEEDSEEPLQASESGDSVESGDSAESKEKG